MSNCRYALAIVVGFFTVGDVFADQIEWTSGFPKTGTGSKTISAKGLITRPAEGWVPDKVEIECWLVAKTGQLVNERTTLKLSDLTDNKDGTWTFGSVEAKVLQGDQPYNIQATVFWNTNGERSRTQPEAKKSSPP